MASAIGAFRASASAVAAEKEIAFWTALPWVRVEVDGVGPARARTTVAAQTVSALIVQRYLKVTWNICYASAREPERFDEFARAPRHCDRHIRHTRANRVEVDT
jgi:hypothetical protein